MEALFIFVSDWKKPVVYGFERLGDEDDKSLDHHGPVEFHPSGSGVT
jgi:hypothetical protein